MTCYIKNCNARRTPQPHPAYRGVADSICAPRNADAETMGAAVEHINTGTILPS